MLKWVSVNFTSSWFIQLLYCLLLSSLSLLSSSTFFSTSTQKPEQHQSLHSLFFNMKHISLDKTLRHVKFKIILGVYAKNSKELYQKLFKLRSRNKVLMTGNKWKKVKISISKRNFKYDRQIFLLFSHKFALHHFHEINLENFD